ncbi:hypothetical protein [Corynebacterium halotolerans]|uniref:glucose-6-phosphate 1-epimerase n=1 Tax=Corynebacterium halotolerans YIM 70093 = DSM 44683 TaxID=1121362 RepID=M1NUH3_9CORY|nr:hypothetical protein [Corynebacterium halotolerans]AGF73142.1 hypothetical protein A605_10710 [Corynebacterium halotolerans YIM 70093 = DSM 44683]
MSDLLTSGRLTISPVGAHLTSADTTHGELFYLSSTSRYGVGESIRGGVPVIAPWFADLLGLEPKHGWARRSEWDTGTGKGGFRASLTRDGLALQLLGIELSDGVHLQLSAANESDETKTVQLAFHPYFAVSDVAEISVRGLDGVDVLDRLTGQASRQKGDITFDGEFDRIALGTPEVTIVDRDRTITVTPDGTDSTVVWNPGAELADTLPDIGPGEWQRFVCVEPALLGARQRGVELAPGEDLQLGMTVSASGTGS